MLQLKNFLYQSVSCIALQFHICCFLIFLSEILPLQSGVLGEEKCISFQMSENSNHLVGYPLPISFQVFTAAVSISWPTHSLWNLCFFCYLKRAPRSMYKSLLLQKSEGKKKNLPILRIHTITIWLYLLMFWGKGFRPSSHCSVITTFMLVTIEQVHRQLVYYLPLGPLGCLNTQLLIG